MDIPFIEMSFSFSLSIMTFIILLLWLLFKIKNLSIMTKYFVSWQNKEFLLFSK